MPGPAGPAPLVTGVLNGPVPHRPVEPGARRDGASGHPHSDRSSFITPRPIGPFGARSPHRIVSTPYAMSRSVFGFGMPRSISGCKAKSVQVSVHRVAMSRSARLNGDGSFRLNGDGSFLVQGTVPFRFKGRFLSGSRDGSFPVQGTVPFRFTGRFLFGSASFWFTGSPADDENRSGCCQKCCPKQPGVVRSGNIHRIPFWCGKVSEAPFSVTSWTARERSR